MRGGDGLPGSSALELAFLRGEEAQPGQAGSRKRDWDVWVPASPSWLLGANGFRRHRPSAHRQRVNCWHGNQMRMLGAWRPK